MLRFDLVFNVFPKFRVLDGVLGQNKYTKVRLYNFASSPPITLIFTHEARYISKFLLGKNWGTREKITPISSIFRKKWGLKKHAFSELVEISEIDFWK